jgi:hypothetical protein
VRLLPEQGRGLRFRGKSSSPPGGSGISRENLAQAGTRPARPANIGKSGPDAGVIKMGREMNEITQAGGTPDLLSSIMGVMVRNEEKIVAEDREFCEARQMSLHATLHQLKWWYSLFTSNAERYRESHSLTYTENGSVDTSKLSRRWSSSEREDYEEFEFLPFDGIDNVVQLYGKAVEAFGCDIIRYFNRKYDVSVSRPDFDDEKLQIGFLPTYQTYVDAVIEYLGGKSFCEIAEEELLSRFHNVVLPHYRRKLSAELKGDKIVFSDILRFESYSWQETLHLTNSASDSLNTLCAGIMFGMTGSLTGGTDFIAGYNRTEIDVSRWYGMNTAGSMSVKFFKNGRVDFRFESADAAERCWKKLRLDTFKAVADNE